MRTKVPFREPIPIDIGVRDQKSRHILGVLIMLFLALVSLAVFVIFQQSAIHDPNFRFLMFSSFFFLGAGTFLLMITFVRSFGAEKSICFGIAIVFIVATLFVANSLAQIPRGGLVKNTSVTPENITLTIYGQGVGAFSRAQILHSADYPVGAISVSSIDHYSIRISTQNAVRLNAILIFNLWLLPYDTRAHSQFELVTFGRDQWGENYIFVYPHQIAIRFQEFARYHPENRVRLEGYYLEFTVGMIVCPTDHDLPFPLNFTFDMSNFPFSISDLVVDSKFENGLSITLSSIFAGVNCYIPINLLTELLLRKKRTQAFRFQR